MCWIQLYMAHLFDFHTDFYALVLVLVLCTIFLTTQAKLRKRSCFVHTTNPKVFVSINALQMHAWIGISEECTYTEVTIQEERLKAQWRI